MLSTTELLVEHIISGILSLVWIVAIIACFLGIDPSILSLIKSYWGLFAVVATAVAYPIGIIIDTFADKLLSRWNEGIRKNKGLPDGFSLMVLLYKLKDENIVNYFTYNRFKTRVARSSGINFAMIGWSLALFVWLQGDTIGILQSKMIGIIILIIIILFFIFLLHNLI